MTESPPPPRRFLSLAQLSDHTGLSVNVLGRWAREGKIPCLKAGVKRVFNADAVEAAITKLAGESWMEGKPAKNKDVPGQMDLGRHIIEPKEPLTQGTT